MKNLKICDECQSQYKAETSKMENLCPECSHLLYGYENCRHQFENGNRSGFLGKLKQTTKRNIITKINT